MDYFPILHFPLWWQIWVSYSYLSPATQQEQLDRVCTNDSLLPLSPASAKYIHKHTLLHFLKSQWVRIICLQHSFHLLKYLCLQITWVPLFEEPVDLISYEVCFLNSCAFFPITLSSLQIFQAVSSVTVALEMKTPISKSGDSFWT